MLTLPKLQNLPNSFAIDGSVRIEIEEGIPIFRASSTVRERIETLLEKQHTSHLTFEEERELDLYEEIDDYLSFVNRTVRNVATLQFMQRMRYVTSVERMARQEERDRETSFVVRLLENRLGSVEETLVERVRRLPIDRVEDLGVNLLNFESEADLVRWLDSLEN